MATLLAFTGSWHMTPGIFHENTLKWLSFELIIHDIFRTWSNDFEINMCECILVLRSSM